MQWDFGGDNQVLTDRQWMKKVLLNLFDNAVHHTDQAGHVSIATSVHDGYLQLQVSNSGSNIPANDVRHVFERFWRGITARESTGRHAGLGLAICKQLSELLGIHITVESNQGRSFAVQLQMPLHALGTQRKTTSAPTAAS